VRRVAVIGTGALDVSSLVDADEVIVLDPSPEALLAALDDVSDPRYAFQLGALPVLPLPDHWVDEIDGPTSVDPELERIRR
jgi:hypothetical protein